MSTVNVFFSCFVGFLLLVASGAQDACTGLPRGDTPFVCPNAGIVIIDATPDLSRDRVTEVFNFMYNLLPGVGFQYQQQVSFMTYGTGTTYTNPMAAFPQAACIEVRSLQEASEREGQNPVTLQTALQSLQANYAAYILQTVPVVIFTADQNQAEIDAAATYARQNLQRAKFTIVNLANGDFSNFPGTVFSAPNALNTYPGLRRCVLKNLCDVHSAGFDDYDGPSDTCDINNNVPSTAPTYYNRGPQCQCKYETVWNDVMFLFDSSRATTKQGLDELLEHVKADMAFFTVKKAPTTTPQEHMRVGIIQYDSTVSVYAPLGSLDNDGINAIDELPFRDDPNINTNLEGAIQAALNEFNGAAHRRNARKVIILLTPTYKPGQFLDPQEMANTFKEDNGVLVVYEYIEKHGAVAPELYNISSTGYFVTSDMDTDSNFLKNALCQANCFCADNYRSFVDYTDGSPAQGCYYASYTQTNWQLAQAKCQKFNNGYLAVDESPEKLQFLRQQFDSSVPFWIGLSYGPGGWVAADGDPLSSGQYTNWGPGEPKSQTCAYVPPSSGFNLKWSAATDCRNSYFYVCEAAPCDSTRYCTDDA